MTRRGKWRVGLLIAAGALLLGFGTAYVASEDIRYLTRAGFEEPSARTKQPSSPRGLSIE